MAVQVTLHVDAQAVLEKFGSMSGEIEKAVDIALNKGALLVEGTAKRLAPVDTGRLRSSIITRVDQKAISRSILPTVKYAIFVHEGTRFMQGRPFLYNAKIAEEENIRELFSNEINKVLNK